MEILTGQKIADLCDYSFGDQTMLWDKNVDGTYHAANAHNKEFLKACKKREGKLMTVFIDNIRLYQRPVEADSEIDQKYVDFLMKTNNLLKLCSLLPCNGFMIFTGQEDTPIDENIAVPFNVEKIYAVNALYNNEKIIPFPYGLQRKIGENDHRLEMMKDNVENYVHREPNKLLYINCGIGRNKGREYLTNFEGKSWTTTRFDKDSKFFPYDRYQDFLDEIKDHKFMICPQGHGMDCHRNWETLYMKRVPVMKDCQYFRRLMNGLPVLFVNDWSEVTEELLEENDDLYQQMLEFDTNRLDAEVIFDELVAKENKRLGL